MVRSCSRFLPGITLLLLTCLVAAACKTVPHNAAVSDTEQQAAPAGPVTYMADTAQSYIRWTGSRPGKKHYGTLHLLSGGLAVQNDRITGGRFEIAVNSFNPQDQRQKGNDLLRRHLLGEDFFEAGKYPVILFEIVSVERTQASAAQPSAYMVTGNLRLRDVTRSIRFPAEIDHKNGVLTANAAFSFDRTDWGLNYGNDKSLGNWFIRPQVSVKLHLTARKI